MKPHLQFCGTCTRLLPADALIKLRSHAQCTVSKKIVKNARKESCGKYERKMEL